jgi:hypothetical protein
VDQDFESMEGIINQDYLNKKPPSIMTQVIYLSLLPSKKKKKKKKKKIIFFLSFILIFFF